jgi:hypothetical protein
MAVVPRLLAGLDPGLDRSGAKHQARRPVAIGRDHVAGGYQQPEEKDQRKQGHRESALMPDSAHDAPHAVQTNAVAAFS